MLQERREELSREENSSKSVKRQQSDPRGKGPSADVHMVFMLPIEFLAPFSDGEEIDFPSQIAQLALDPMTTILRSLPMMKDRILRLCLSKAGLMGSRFLRYSLMEGMQ